MKLKRHRAGLDEATKKWISGPVDIEGHRGKDGRYYVLDYVRRRHYYVILDIIMTHEPSSGSHVPL